MKILLVAPCPPGEQRPKSMDIPQLTLSLIASMTPPEYEVEICEEVYDDVINFDGDYHLIGISIMTQTCLRGYAIANEFRNRGKKVVFGGIHATCLPEEALQYGDAVVVGEAEGGLWPKLLEDLKVNRLRKIYKLDHFPDLEQAVRPRTELIRCHSGRFAIAPIETSRGCPYNCDFCTVSRFFGTRQRHKKISSIIEEAEALPQKYLFFLDDNITGDKRFAAELFRELAHLKKIWVGQASVNLSKDDELMKLAWKSGCRSLLIGFESMTDEGLNHYRKSLKSIDENVLAVNRLRDNGILVMASLIFGLDSDTEETFDVGLEFIEKSRAAFFQSCIVTPYPGTPVFEKLKTEKRILTDDWSKFDTTKVNIIPKNYSPERLLEGSLEIQKKVYSNMSLMKRALPNMMQGLDATVLYWSLNKGYQKRLKAKRIVGVNRNAPGVPVDFNMAKYVAPSVPVDLKQESRVGELVQ